MLIHTAFLKSVARLLSVHGFDVRTFNSAEALLDSDATVTAPPMLPDIHLGARPDRHRDRAFVAGSRAQEAFARVNSFWRLWVVQIMAHSARTFSTPRNRNWRNPRACLICPNTGSTTCFRNR